MLKANLKTVNITIDGNHWLVNFLTDLIGKFEEICKFEHTDQSNYHLIITINKMRIHYTFDYKEFNSEFFEYIKVKEEVKNVLEFEQELKLVNIMHTGSLFLSFGK